VLFGLVAGSQEVNHNDDYQWYYSSMGVVDGGQPLYRGVTPLTVGDVDVKMTRCCSRLPDDSRDIINNFTESC